MSLFTGLEQIVKVDEPLAPHTWLNLGGPASYFIEPTSSAELVEVIRRCRDNDVPMHVLGGGANLLIDDAGVKGAVIRLAGGEFAEFTLAEGRLTAGAGADMSKLVLRTVRAGLSGVVEGILQKEPRGLEEVMAQVREILTTRQSTAPNP